MNYLFLLVALLLFSACGNPDYNAVQAASEDVLASGKCVEISVDVEPLPTTAQEDIALISEELSGI